MSEKEKRYSQDEVNKIVTETKEAFWNDIPTIDIHIGANPYRSAPEVTIKITGGDITKVRGFGVRVSEMLMREIDSMVHE